MEGQKAAREAVSQFQGPLNWDTAIEKPKWDLHYKKNNRLALSVVHTSNKAPQSPPYMFYLDLQQIPHTHGFKSP